LSLEITGEDQPSPLVGENQITFLLSLHSVGNLNAERAPFWLGPRNSGQSPYVIEPKNPKQRIDGRIESPTAKTWRAGYNR
jgi:hypothetical protein